MNIVIGKFHRKTATVPVTFTEGDIVHERVVNAVLKDDGSYDKAETKLRVDDVARGVAAKISAGAITNAPEVIESPDPVDG